MGDQVTEALDRARREGRMPRLSEVFGQPQVFVPPTPQLRKKVRQTLASVVIPRPKKMNRTEAAYDRQLGMAQDRGDIVGRKFEGLRLRLADGTFYTPDFMVVRPGRLLELHEVKAWWKGKRRGQPGRAGWREDARLKVKMAAEQYPWFVFRAAVLRDGEWLMEVFPPWMGVADG